ncbi:hypothetical protein ElyMa_004046400 [Elysia marginata]|uniref:Uncharacterized protein n=1 Tax=Elysia marginata TaxID=1093978 RepID=A0AAV4G4A5_9GAST|nr:hypothetical protein ElyMa_004046400 [Elysia marginata]
MSIDDDDDDNDDDDEDDDNDDDHDDPDLVVTRYRGQTIIVQQPAFLAHTSTSERNIHSHTYRRVAYRSYHEGDPLGTRYDDSVQATGISHDLQHCHNAHISLRRRVSLCACL